jgi:intracellular multiplication protein IcmB
MFPFQSIFSKSTKMSMFNYCNIEANVTDSTDVSKNDTFVNKDGSYSSFYNLNGCAKSIASKGIHAMASRLEERMKGNLEKKGFRIQFVFENNPDYSNIPIDECLNPVLAAMKRANIPINRVVGSRKDKLLDKTSYEKCFMVITTFPLIKQAGQAQMTENRTEKGSKLETGIKPGEFGQSQFFELTELLDTHSGICSTLEKSLSEFLFFEKLDCHTALLEVRKTIENQEVSSKWKPHLLGDRMRPRLVKDGNTDIDQSHILNMDIGFQLFNKTPFPVEGMPTSIQYGTTMYAPLNLDLPPQDPTPFYELFKDVDNSIPWRFSFVIETGHKEILSKINNKKSFATFLAITSSDNKAIKEAAEEFIGIAKSGKKLVSCKATFCTWAKDKKTLAVRKSILSQAIQGWGAGDVIDELGDPIELWTNTLPGISQKFISTPFPLTIGEAFYISPISRPASPWKKGTALYRTIDRKLFPVEPSSKRQASWFDIYFAPPGSGKSFKLAADNMSFIMNPRNVMLPRLAMLDIGFSSQSFVEFLRAMMPKEMSHQFKALKLKMSKTDTSNDINPFDTPLGCRSPLSLDREFLINFLTIAFTPAGSKDPIVRLPEFLGVLVDEMYAYFSDENSPVIYQIGTNNEIDTLLEQEEFTISQYTTWWQIVDYFFDRKDYRLATMAQRYAMPTLNEISTVVTNSNNIKDSFGRATMHGADELLIDYVKQMSMSVVNEYPILSRPSSLDLSYARVVSLDLSEVTPQGSSQADKKTAIMYMTGRYVLCKDFYQKESDTVPQVPDKYKNYHRARLQAEATVPKKLCMDEYHRTSKTPSVREQVELDVREGRKFLVNIALASQKLTDFDPDIVGLADNMWILSKGKTEDDLNLIKSTFAPEDDVIDLMKNYVTGPSSEGSSFLYIGNLKDTNNRVEQILYLTISALEIWGYTTVHEDYNLRQSLVSKVGIGKAMDILTSKFPSGSAIDYVDLLKEDYEGEKLGEIYNIAANKLAMDFLVN